MQWEMFTLDSAKVSGSILSSFIVLGALCVDFLLVLNFFFLTSEGVD